MDDKKWWLTVTRDVVSEVGTGLLITKGTSERDNASDIRWVAWVTALALVLGHLNVAVCKSSNSPCAGTKQANPVGVEVGSLLVSVKEAHGSSGVLNCIEYVLLARSLIGALGKPVVDGDTNIALAGQPPEHRVAPLVGFVASFEATTVNVDNDRPVGAPIIWRQVSVEEQWFLLFSELVKGRTVLNVTVPLKLLVGEDSTSPTLGQVLGQR
jgi:hypothetical protein